MAFKLPSSVTSISQSISNFGTTRVSDGRYFQTTKRGEIQELKDELHSANKDKKKEAVKKVIAAMTVGKDVSNLFADVVNCMQTTNLELKKLVYLYVINYAKAQPELAILAVNTFRKDSLYQNPLIRALAVRTMGCIRLEQITEYLVEPLRRACKDQDPYVRKTAAICVAKLYDTSPEAVEDQGFIEVLQDMLGDSNPMVVANAVAALSELSETAKRAYLKLNESNVSKLLNALNECTEWGQVFILDAVSKYSPKSFVEAEDILDRVIARLSHANAAVVMSAIKVVMHMLDCTDNSERVRGLQRKLSPPLVTLLSAEPEVQYVVLRNIGLIAQKRPGILAGEVKMFFCKYNDPIYVKMEKLEIIVRLASERNIDQVLSELKEYATEVDIDFVRKAVRCIGRCAIKLDAAAQRCINVLLDLIATRVNYVVQESIVVIKDIFRKYPNRYEQVIAALCENLDSLDEPEAKASMIWIIGEYAERIDNADELIDGFLENFHDEPSAVQLQILTAGVKLFLKSPKTTKSLVTRLLKMSTEESENPDLRDRGYIYWRLLSSNPEATKSVVLSEKPTITDSSYGLDSALLDELVESISMLSSVYQKPPRTFVVRMRGTRGGGGGKGDDNEESSSDSQDDERPNPQKIEEELRNAAQYSSGEEEDERSNEGDGDESDGDSSSSSSRSAGQIDLLGLDDESSAARRGGTRGASVSSSGGLVGAAVPTLQGAAQAPPPKVNKVPILSPQQAGSRGNVGLEVQAGLTRFGGQIQLHMQIINHTPTPLGNWALQFNRNCFGLAPIAPLQLSEVHPGCSAEAVLPLNPNQILSDTPPTNPLVLQIAIRTSIDVFYMTLPHGLEQLLVEKEPLDRETFRSNWDRLEANYRNDRPVMVQAAQRCSPDGTQAALRAANIRLVAHQSFDTHEFMLFSCFTVNNILILLEICLQNPSKGNGVKITFRSDGAALRDLCLTLVMSLLGLPLPSPNPAAN